MSGQPARLAYAALADHVGAVFGPSPEIVMEQATIDRFADLTGDHQWVHVDTERAGREMGGTIAHGYLTLAMVPAIVESLIEITGVAHGLNYGLERVRFPAPLRAGERFAGTVRLVGAAPRGEGMLVTMETTLAVPGAPRPMCIAQSLTLLLPGEGILGGRAR